MSTPPQLLNEIGRVKGPGFNLPGRIFVFGEHEGRPGYAAIYISKAGKADLYDLQPIASFTRSRTARSVPHVITLESGEEWAVTREGCGCGSPYKKVGWTQPMKDAEVGRMGSRHSGVP